MARKFSELRGKMTPERRARNDAAVKQLIAEMPLQELRRARDLTQTTLAKTMRMNQGDLSKLEQRTDCYVSTLRSYIHALGGELDIVAHFPDGDVKITQFSDLKTGTDG